MLLQKRFGPSRQSAILQENQLENGCTKHLVLSVFILFKIQIVLLRESDIYIQVASVTAMQNVSLTFCKCDPIVMEAEHTPSDPGIFPHLKNKTLHQ